jgi:hypothetical protein
MNCGLFETFCDLLESIPIKAVVRAADAERKMVQDDLEKKRTERDECVNSVLDFCDFLADAVRGIHASIPIFPVEHCAFYRKIIHRLVDAGELPAEIVGEFERIFSRALSRALTIDNKHSEAVPDGRLTYTMA